jgi:hypothetical protein
MTKDQIEKDESEKIKLNQLIEKWLNHNKADL